MILKSKTAYPLRGRISGVCMLPSTGEFSLATTPVSYNGKVVNRNSTNSQKIDSMKSLDHLQETLPNCKWVSLIASWFGSDLRIGECKIEPKVENKLAGKESSPLAWEVAGWNRQTANQPSVYSTGITVPDPYASGTGASIAHRDAVGHEGIDNTASTITFAPTGWQKCASWMAGLDVNTNYTVKFWVRNSEGGTPVPTRKVKMGWEASGSTNKYQDYNIGNNWTQITFTFLNGIGTAGELQWAVHDENWNYDATNIQISDLWISKSDGAYRSWAYGATPSDNSVLEYIRECNRRNLKVMFYPFILMDIPHGNTLPKPDGSGNGQDAYPWRGRIETVHIEDKLPATKTAVDNFFGTAKVSDFSINGDKIVYTGTNEKSYRRMILHYAYLCSIAGGVKAFCIGTEMRGLTWARDGRDSFPAVDQYVKLLEECKVILGTDCEVTYASDWTEFTPYQPQDGSGDVYHHLDPIWSNSSCDFIGIDNYVPLSDWRGGADVSSNPDYANFKSIYDTNYLKASVEGGELYDYYYASEADRNNNVRTPLSTDYRYRVKDHKGVWQNKHKNRQAGADYGDFTAWVPKSKRIVYTEFGCAAIDKGSNQPNKFLDPKSAESTAPYFSDGTRDDRMQQRYYEAFTDYWDSAKGHNPQSDVYSGPMVDDTMMFAWAWDARPYPEFPTNSALWADAANYPMGHWLAGRPWIEVHG